MNCLQSSLLQLAVFLEQRYLCSLYFTLVNLCASQVQENQYCFLLLFILLA